MVIQKNQCSGDKVFFFFLQIKSTYASLGFEPGRGGAKENNSLKTVMMWDETLRVEFLVSCFFQFSAQCLSEWLVQQKCF